MLNYFKDTNFDFDKIKYRSHNGIIYVDAYYIPEDQFCPKCGSNTYSKNGYKIKTVKHCIYYTSLFIVKCHIQRYVCKHCSHSFYEKDTFSNSNEVISKESIDMIINKLKFETSTFESVARDTHLSRQNIIDIFDRYIDYKPNKLPEILSFDEKHINNSLTSNAYIFIILDFKEIKIYDIVFSRHKSKLENYFSKIPLSERLKVKYITIDMWETYLDICKRFFKNAKISIDSFHVTKMINNALDRIRLIVMQKYNQKTDNLEDNNPFYYVLKKFKYYLLKEYDDLSNGRFYNSKLKMWFNKYSIIKYMLDINDDLSKAYSLASKYREFNRACNIENAREELESLINHFFDSGLSQFFEVAKTLSTWKEYIINSFIRINDCLSKKDNSPRRLSNGPIEGINSRIEKININGNGYTNFFRFRNRCIHVINK